MRQGQVYNLPSSNNQGGSEARPYENPRQKQLDLRSPDCAIMAFPLWMILSFKNNPHIGKSPNEP